MQDRELLELAAKAAGVAGRFIEEMPEDGHPRYRCGIGKVGAVTTIWNPLINDGDALRLAARLGIFLRTDFVQTLSRLMNEGVDHCKATRQAIVIIAAKIGDIK